MLEIEGHAIAEHVDDISQLTIKSNSTSALMTAVAQGVALATCLVEMELTISKKSVVVSNSAGLAERVARQLRAKGFPLKTEVHSEDLGVSTRGGKARSVGSMNARISKAEQGALDAYIGPMAVPQSF